MLQLKGVYALCAMVVLVATGVLGDTPANCTYEQIEGTWTFSTGPIYRSFAELNATTDCTKFSVARRIRVTLRYPDVATDEFGNVGFWTLIYNQGFEVRIANRKYFAFSRYEGSAKEPTSICNETLPSYTHDVLQRQWACYSAVQVSGSTVQTGAAAHLQYTARPQRSVTSGFYGSRLASRRYRPNHELIKQVNLVQNSWVATHYRQFEGKSLRDLQMMQGGPATQISRPRAAPVSRELQAIGSALPEAFDWRSVGGQSFVAPVRSQAQCGSCYGFAAAAMLESRLRIASNNSLQPILSPQDVVECSPYSQGCNGGFPYLVGGKYAEDFGFVEESCNPYKGKDGACSTSSKCTRYYGTGYHYVGGYYGACNEEVMKLALLHDGPLAVGFEVYPDFRNYKTGVYVHTGLLDRFNPFELTNHAVLLVGYGVDADSGVKYWTVKNSWGDAWGESGYFRIRRGTDECGIESLAVTTRGVL